MTGAQNPGRLNTVAEIFCAAFRGAVGSEDIQLEGEKTRIKMQISKSKL